MELFEALESFIVAYFREALVDAYEDFWGAFVGREAELSHELLHLSNDAQFMWFVCDCELESRKTVLDLLLEHDSTLSAGAQAFARVIRRAKMCAYEAIEVVPGVSITLRDVLSGTTVTVGERTASRTLNRHDWIAARIVERGPSGKAEMERGVLAIPRLYKEWLSGELTELREEAIENPDLVSMDEALPRLVHELWVGCILEPAIPQLHNTDGEPTLITRAHFDVKDRTRLERALDSCSALTREGSQWVWFGKNARDTQVLLGTFEFKGRGLLLETNSKERGERGVALLRKLCGDAAVHRATTHEDLEPMLRADLKAQARGERMIEDEARPTEGGLPPVIAEALVLDHYAKHYRAWIDERVPALDGETPRDAARTSTQQGRVRELIKGLETTYQQCLREGTPAYDPSWMWSELDLLERAQQLPPPLPHERLEHFIEGTRELVVDVAESIRVRPGFDDASTVVEPASVQRLLDVQRFLKEHPKCACRRSSLAAPRTRAPCAPGAELRAASPQGFLGRGSLDLHAGSDRDRRASA